MAESTQENRKWCSQLFSTTEAIALVLLSLSLVTFTGIRIIQRNRPAGKDIEISVGADIRHQINLNEATITQLTLIPGIGPARAENIIRYRQGRPGGFQNLDELGRVDGLSERLLEQIRSYFTVVPNGMNSN